ncbi:MAG: hypothetical protein CMH54_00695 [Myxococcales bacterium]|nr:hypothetical protein [Myxococcales bacterium]
MRNWSQYRTVRAAILVGFVWLLLFSTKLHASDSLPAYPPALDSSAHRIAVVGVADVYDPFRAFLVFDSQVSAKYTVAVIGKPSSEKPTGLRDYAARLQGHWSQSLDPNYGVLIVFAQTDGTIWMVPGTSWAQLGFEGAEISAVVEKSGFAGRVEKTEYAEALSDLVVAVDARLTRLKQETVSGEQNVGAELERAWSRLQRMKEAVVRYKASSGVHDLVRLAEELLDDTESLRARPVQALRSIRRAQQTMDTAQRYVEDSRPTRSFLDRSLPILVGLLILLCVWLAFWRGRGPAPISDKESKKRVEDWAQRLERLERRILDLQNSYPSVYGTAGLYERLEGLSHEKFSFAGRKSDELFMCCHVLKLRLEDARLQLKLAEDVEESDQHRKVLSLLEDDVLEVGMMSQENLDFRCLVPDEWGDRRPAGEWLEWAEGPLDEWIGTLRLLDEALRDVPMQLVQSKRSLKVAQSALRALDRLGVDTMRYAHLFTAITPRLSRMEKMIWTDPLAAVEAMESFRAETAQLESSASVSIDSVRMARAGLTRLRQEVERVEGLRKENSFIGEPGFEPEGMLADALERYGELVDAVVVINPDRTVELAQEIVDRGEQLHQLVNTALEVPGSVEEELERLTAELEEMESSYPEATARLDELETKNNDAALTVLRGRVQEIEGLLAFARQCAATFASDAKAGLRSREVLQRFGRALGAARTVFDELEDVDDNFAELRNEALQHLQDVERDVAMVKQMLDRDPRFAAPDLGDQVKQQSSELTRLRHELQLDRPDCVGLHRACVRLHEEAHKVLEESVVAQREYQRTGVLQEEVRALADQVSVHVSLEEYEGSPARERYEQGRVLLAQIRADLACQANPDWHQAARVLSRAQRLLRDAEWIAHEKLNEENVARRSIAEIHSLRAELALSRPDLGGFQTPELNALMVEAQGHLEAERYGQAIATARNVEKELDALADQATIDTQAGITALPDEEDVRWEALHLWARTPEGGDAFGTTSGASGFTV